MTESKSESEAILELIDQLSGKDPVTRQASREKLVEIGGEATTRALVAELVDPRKQVRWEAAKALTAIADPVAAPGLMHALDDEDEDVRWVAGEGLVALGRVGLLTTLSGLTKRARSLEFRKGAHRVLHDLRPKGFAKTVDPVLKALGTSEPAVTAPPVAFEALMALKSER